MLLKLYVPHPDAHYLRGIAKGSAIVALNGTDRPDGQVLVYLRRGNAYSSSSLALYNMRALIAAGRACARYPTVAMMTADPRALVEVGTFDVGQKAVIEISDPEALQAWLGDEPLPVIGQRAEDWMRHEPQ